MDCSTANVAHGSPASHDSSDEPLRKMKTTFASSKTLQKKENKSSRSNGANKITDLSTDEDSDNEPLIKDAKVSSKAAKKTCTKTPLKKSADKKKKDLNTDDDSDNEPLVNIAKVSSKAAKKTFTVPPKKTLDKKKEQSPDDSSSSDEPLSETAKKLRSQHKRKSPSKKESPAIKSKRTAASKKVIYVEFSSDSSDDETLPAKKKRTIAAKRQKPSANKKTKSIPTDKTSKDNSSDEDDDDNDDNVPLRNLIGKKNKPVKQRTTKKTSVSLGRPDESSDDEPLIHFVKKNCTDFQTKAKTKASPPKKRDTTPKKPREVTVSVKASGKGNSSYDELLAAKHPEVTKMVRIVLERCDGKDTGPKRSQNKTRTADTLVAEEPMKEDGLEESSEEE
ncbi:nucleolar and coiled-body phosphoprotein 1-like isoform X4 [Mastacembelus armatus]|uniref:nucleolar and coiled-body phosphoprotein 1-like isoform X4 n=1 Tax=Mastacembelus armatus TaxID=205130 RepID=UPI000E4623E1|nr:nucleolar and coiled-body phosphoprotein 1-like isoform X4 [Mastacembelus armatus]